MRRRSIAGTAATLVTILAIGVPLASPGHAAPTTLQCGSGDPAAACELLDDLSAQLGPITPLLGTALAPLAAEAQDLAARSDSAAGVPTAEVVDVSEALLAAFDTLPAPVQSLIGATRLGEVTNTLDALVETLTAPAAGGQESSSGSAPTPAKATSSSTAAPLGGARAAQPSHADAPSSTGGATSSDGVPDVPVGDPLTLAPLALPDFGFDQSFVPAALVEVAAPSAEEAQLAALTEAMGRGGGRSAEVAVVAVMSLLLLAGAGIAQLQANRHQIPD